MTAVFAVAILAFGLVQAAIAFAGEETYRELARGRGQVTFTVGELTLQTDESGLVELHRQTVAYVLGRAAEPATCCGGRPLFDASERSHLADVRGVFRAAEVASAVAGIVAAAIAVGARRSRLRLVRDGALWAGALVLVIGVVAAVAFEPAFLAFHYLFFPQGNFLFDPATSSLLRLYPEPYWYGVTLRVGVTFIVVMALLAGMTTIALRARGAR